MRKLVTLILITVLTLTAASCSGYNENYSALVMVSSEGNNHAYMTFEKFRGTRVLDLNNSDEDKDTIYYSGSIENGSVTVYIDYDGNKTELFTLEGSNEEEGSLEVTDMDLHKVYVIIETDEECVSGNFDFEIAE